MWIKAYITGASSIPTEGYFHWLKACKHTWCATLQFDPVAPHCVVQNKLYIYLPRLLILSNTMRSKRIVLHCSPLHVFTSLQTIQISPTYTPMVPDRPISRYTKYHIYTIVVVIKLNLHVHHVSSFVIGWSGYGPCRLSNQVSHIVTLQ